MSNVPSNFTDGVFTATDDAGHSATLALAEGDFSLTTDAQGGREVSYYQTRGAVSGVRKGARKIATLTMSAKLADPGAAFQQLVQGRTSGFVSVVADIGDATGVDWDFSFDYGAQARAYYGEDMIVTEIKIDEGDPSKITFSADLIGPIYSSDSTNGTVTLVPSR